MASPTPPDAIPDFLIEQFDDLSPETLRGTADYAREETYLAPDEMPDKIKEAFVLQDDDTVAAVADYADELAAFLEARDADSLRGTVANASGGDESWGHRRILQWHE
ncbi:hypothetical protein [Natrinema pallidum]|uniref:Uncharacterized protein n=2 Tax=Natrinema pallidum TaxID=69527 RepID=L9YY52_9EURY|nr:hypothetical protein [Natrinema pallidum]ELY78561.1 hypothetical protein C487_07972 [Natrinema pallidum DSM 3751]QCW01922.1 hypothetical protein FGF80_01105 [Natrinema pallidum]